MIKNEITIIARQLDMCDLPYRQFSGQNFKGRINVSNLRKYVPYNNKYKILLVCSATNGMMNPDKPPCSESKEATTTSSFFGDKTSGGDPITAAESAGVVGARTSGHTDDGPYRGAWWHVLQIFRMFEASIFYAAFPATYGSNYCLTMALDIIQLLNFWILHGVNWI